MNAGEIIHQEWLKAMVEMEKTPFFLAIEKKTFTAEHYAMFLREEYFNTHENPEGLVLMASHFKGEQGKLNKKFIRHSLSESGHNQMAADDLSALGYAFEPLKRERPLVTTETFNAVLIFQVQHRNPITNLAYSYHLEHIAVAKGKLFLEHLLSIGIPMAALSFLVEHTEADVGHNLLNEESLPSGIREWRSNRGPPQGHGILFSGTSGDRVGDFG
ncbi:MAG: iron-containing redox enzyme family protein [Fibrobacterota bacterium]|nr:iron-containing redox enzyme family protein [Fibrobacterota bacterium]